MKEVSAFQRYLRDHTDLRADNALKVFRLYDNHEMGEEDAAAAMLTEIEEFIKVGGDDVPNLGVLNEIIVLHSVNPRQAEKAEGATDETPPASTQVRVGKPGKESAEEQ